jgi:hypothetical protein
MGINQMSELASKVSRQFQAAFSERMFERENNRRGTGTFEEVVLSVTSSGSIINLFPCDVETEICANQALFISFSSEHARRNFTALRRDQFIPLERVMQKLVQQVLGKCSGLNKHIVLLTDHLDSEILNPWMPVIGQMMNNGVKFEILYFNTNGQMNLVDMGMFV